MSAKRRICFISENAQGGIVNVNRSLIALLDASLFEFTVVLIGYSWRNVRSAESVFQGMNVQIKTLTLSQDTNKYIALNALQRDVLSRQDLIIATDKYELLAYTIGMLRVPLIFMIHSNWANSYDTALFYNGIIDRYICVSREICSRLKERLAIPDKNKAVYLPHALPEYSLGYMDPYSGDFTAIFIGRFNEVKGADILLTIARSLQKQEKELHFIIISDGVEETAFKKEWPLPDHTSFYSDLPNHTVQEQLAKAQVILMPSRLEGFPVVLVEAMRRGVVPICSDISTGFPELVEDGITGFRLPIQEPGRFEDVLMTLREDRGRLAAMSKECIRTVNAKFDPLKNSDAYKDVFLQSAGERPPRNYPDLAGQLGKFDKPFIPGWFIRAGKRFFGKAK